MTAQAAQESTRATVVEFQKDSSGRFHPFSLTVIEEKDGGLYRTIYDIEHSRKYGYLFDQSGFGGWGPVQVSGPYFASGDVEVKEKRCQLVDGADKAPWRSKKTKAIRARNRTRALRALPKAFAVPTGEDILDWLQTNAIECDSVWCSTCRDSFPEDSLCDHIWWCDTTGWWSTPSDRCKCTSQEACQS